MLTRILDPRKNYGNRISVQEFVNKYKYVYIYGAGKYGKALKHELELLHIRIGGFLVRKNESHPCIDHLPVFEIDSFVGVSNDCGIFIGLNLELNPEVKNELCNKGFHNLYIFPNEILELLHIRDISPHLSYHYYYVREMDILSSKYPPCSLNKSIDPHNILVVRLDRIGDLIWTTAFLEALHIAFPEASISLVILRENKALVKNNPFLENVFYYESDAFQEPFLMENVFGYDKMRNRSYEFAQKYLKGKDFDVSFCARSLAPKDFIENIYLTVFSGAPYRVGWLREPCTEEFESVCKQLFSAALRHKKPVHVVEQMTDMIRACGKDIEAQDTKIYLDDEAVAFARQALSAYKGKHRYLIAVAPVSKGKVREISYKKIARALCEIQNLYQENIGFVLCGGKDAIEAAREITEWVDCLDMTGKTRLLESAAIIKDCDLYLGLDTGLVHMAAAYKVPVVEMVGHPKSDKRNVSLLSPLLHGPWHTESIVLEPERGLDEECESAGECVKTFPHCIEQIMEDDIVKAVQEMLRRISNP